MNHLCALLCKPAAETSGHGGVGKGGARGGGGRAGGRAEARTEGRASGLGLAKREAVNNPTSSPGLDLGGAEAQARHALHSTM